jgi:Cu/Zn superoxide dismutase
VKKLMLALAAAATALAVASLAFGSAAKTHNLSATLNAKQEVPKQAVKKTNATGTFAATLTGTKLKFTLTYSKLSGPAAAAHIHLGKPGKSGNVLVPLCPPCKPKLTKTVTVPATLAKQAQNGLLYVNVHTAKNPAGEIRGQIKSSGG